MAISALTLAELIVGPKAATDDLTRARRESHLRFIEANLETLCFDQACARAYGSIYAAAAQRGRKARGRRAVDLMIAATALAHNLRFFTRNAKDLRGLEGLIEIVDLSA
jgi:predicted nucleic acid-binding protein